MIISNGKLLPVVAIIVSQLFSPSAAQQSLTSAGAASGVNQYNNNIGPAYQNGFQYGVNPQQSISTTNAAATSGVSQYNYVPIQNGYQYGVNPYQYNSNILVPTQNGYQYGIPQQASCSLGKLLILLKNILQNQQPYRYNYQQLGNQGNYGYGYPGNQGYGSQIPINNVGTGYGSNTVATSTAVTGGSNGVYSPGNQQFVPYQQQSVATGSSSVVANQNQGIPYDGTSTAAIAAAQANTATISQDPSSIQNTDSFAAAGAATFTSGDSSNSGQDAVAVAITNASGSTEIA